MKKYKMTIWVELSDDAGHPEKWFYQAIAQQLNHDGEDTFGYKIEELNDDWLTIGEESKREDFNQWPGND